jgi:hypothetical protein
MYIHIFSILSIHLDNYTKYSMTGIENRVLRRIFGPKREEVTEC